jgi:hypothetical protein
MRMRTDLRTKKSMRTINKLHLRTTQFMRTDLRTTQSIRTNEKNFT